MNISTTEDDARALLAKAAATIPVDEDAPMTLAGLPEPRPRRWPVLAAAAAVVLAVGGGALVARQLGDDPAPAPAPGGHVPEPVERVHVFAADEMPSLLTYKAKEATDLLEARGYIVEKSEEHSCGQPAGYVVASDPGPGTPLTAGDSVHLTVTAGSKRGMRCPQPDIAWQQVFALARYALGLGGAPDFPAQVSVAVGANAPVELTSAEAAEADSWTLCDGGECHSPLAALAQILSRPVEMDRSFATTSLVATNDPPGNPAMDTFVRCLTDDPGTQGLSFHPPTYVYVDYPSDGPELCPPPPVIQIGWTDDYRIASVRLRLPAEAGAGAGDELDESSARVTSANQFVDWARGEGPAPAFSRRVRVMYAGGPAFGSTGWTDHPEDRTTYSGCSGLGFPDCGLDPVALLVRHDGPVVATAGRSTCAHGGEVPKRFGEAGDDVVRLEEPESASCRTAWAVELWIDADGVIYGVNQAGG